MRPDNIISTALKIVFIVALGSFLPPLQRLQVVDLTGRRETHLLVVMYTFGGGAKSAAFDKTPLVSSIPMPFVNV